MTLKQMLKSQLYPYRGTDEILELAGDLAVTGWDQDLMVRVSITDGCTPELAQRMWTGNVAEKVRRAGNALRSVKLDGEGILALVEEYLSDPGRDLEGLVLLVGMLRYRLRTGGKLDRDGNPVPEAEIVQAGKVLTRSDDAFMLLLEHQELLTVLAELSGERHEWLAGAAARIDPSEGKQAKLAAALAHLEIDAVTGNLPLEVELGNRDRYDRVVLSYLARHCTSSRERETLATLGNEWGGRVAELVEACKRL